MVMHRTLPPKYATGFLQNVDTRTSLFRRLESSFNEICDDCGGWETMPIVRRSLAERFVYLMEFCREIELEIIKDPAQKATLLGKWIQAVNTMQGLGRALGQYEKPAANSLENLYDIPPIPTTPSQTPPDSHQEPNPTTDTTEEGSQEEATESRQEPDTETENDEVEE